MSLDNLIISRLNTNSINSKRKGIEPLERICFLNTFSLRFYISSPITFEIIKLLSLIHFLCKEVLTSNQIISKF